jgi:hypothetical protein
MQSSTFQAPAASFGSREDATATGSAATGALQQKRDLKLYTPQKLLLFTAIALIVGVSAGYWSATGIYSGASLASHCVPPTVSASPCQCTPATSSTALLKSKPAPARKDVTGIERVAHADLAARFSIDVIDRVRIAPQVAALMRNIAISNADMDIGDNAQFSQYLAESPVLYSRDCLSHS